MAVAILTRRMVTSIHKWLAWPRRRRGISAGIQRQHLFILSYLNSFPEYSWHGKPAPW